jgi:HlyD family secretion protein
MRSRPALWIALATTLVVGAVAWAWRPRPTIVSVAAAQRGTEISSVTEDGRVYFRRRRLIASPVAGEADALGRSAGAEVAAGEVLARIYPMRSGMLDRRGWSQVEAQAEAALRSVSRAEALLSAAHGRRKLADMERDRAVTLFNGQATTAQALEAAKAAADAAVAEERAARSAWAAARAEYRSVRARISSDTEGSRDVVDLVAPFGGRILRVVVEGAPFVFPGTPILELGDAGSAEIIVDVTSADAVRVLPNAAAVLRGWGGGPPISGRVRQVEPQAFSRVSALGVEEQRVNLRIQANDPDELRALGDGFRVEVEVELARCERCLSIPEGALFSWRDGFAVFRLAGPRVERVPVDVGLRDGRRAVIAAGLEEGAMVVVEPPESLEPGAWVRPQASRADGAE